MEVAQEMKRSITLRIRVDPVGQRLPWLVRMQWEDIPKKGGPLKLLKPMPNFFGGSLLARLTDSRADKRRRSPHAGLRVKSNLIGDC